MCLVYIEAWCNGNTKDFDSFVVGSSPAASASRKQDGWKSSIRLSFRPGGRIRSVHPLKSGAMRTASLWCINTLVAVYGLPQQKPFLIWVGRIVAIAAGCKPAGLAYVGSSPTRPTSAKAQNRIEFAANIGGV